MIKKCISYLWRIIQHMKQVLTTFIFLFLCQQLVVAQDHYDPAKALNSEEIFLKSNPSHRFIAQAGQKYLVLDANPTIGGFHRYRFFPGDQIKFRMKNETIRFNETIAAVKDSSFTIGIVNDAAVRMDFQDVPLKEVKLVKIHKQIPFVSQGVFLLPLAGILYMGADFFNKGIDNKRYTMDSSSFVVGGAFIATGFICYKLTFATIKVNGKNKLKVLETF